MSSFWCVRRGFFATAIGLAAGLASFQPAWSQVAPGAIPDHDSIFIDGQSFKITPGNAKPEAAERIKSLGARELGAGAIVFRSGDKLYIIGAPLVLDLTAPRGPEIVAPSGPEIPERAASGRPESPAVDADKAQLERINIPSAPLDQKAQLNRIHIQYDPPGNPKHMKLYETLMEHQVLEQVQQILSPLRLPVALTIKTLGCNGLINSWYDVDNSVPTVHMCYELLQNILHATPDQNIFEDITYHDAVVGQSLFWTLHELGHAAFDIYKVPVFGREEDAADLFAAYLMLHFGKDQARRWILGAAYSAEEFMKDFGPVDNFASVHGLPQQRFYNLLCLAFGADPKTFADVTHSMMSNMTEKGYLPQKRADNCEYEFQTFDRSFKSAFGPYIDRQLAKAVMDTSWFPDRGLPPR
jgi:hypothetical protein